MTADEFLTLPDIEEQRVELFDGEVVDMPSGGPNHERAKANLNEILVAWLVQHKAGKVFTPMLSLRRSVPSTLRSGACTVWSWPTTACMRRTPGEDSVFSISRSTSTGNWPL